MLSRGHLPVSVGEPAHTQFSEVVSLPVAQ